MADDTATTALVFDATGAKEGAAEFATAAEKVIAANDAAATSNENATKRIATSTSSQANYINRLAAQFDPLGAAVTKALLTIERLNDIISAGGPNAAKAASLIEGATKNLSAAMDAQTKGQDGVANSAKKTGYVIRDFGIQAEQFFSQVATGQPVLTAFIQQAHQMGDVALSSGLGFGALGAAAKAAWGFIISPTGLAIAGVAAVGGAIAIAASHAIDLSVQTRALNTAIAGAGRQADLSAGQLNNYITSLQHAGVATAAAQSIVTNLTRNPSLSQSQIGQIVTLTPDVAAGSGQDAAATAQLIANSFTGGYVAVQKLDDVLRVFTSDQLTAIRNADLQGNTFKAQGVEVDALSTRFRNAAAGGLSDFGKAELFISNTWNDFWNSITKQSPDVFGTFSKLALISQGLATPDIKSPVDALAAVARLADQASSSPATSAPASAVDAQTKLTNDLTQAYKDQAAVLAAGMPIRDQVRARIEAENIAADKGLDTAHTKLLVDAAVTAAALQAGDAATQEAAAMQRQIQGGTLLASVMDQGRAAIITATAAVQAHDKAATQAGVSELAFAQAIINRDAAAQASKGVDQVNDLKDQVEFTKQLVDAEQLGDRAAHYAELSVNLDKLTKESEAYRDTTTDPNIKAALETIIGKTGDLAFQQSDLTNRSDNLKAILTSQDALTVLAKQGELIGANATETARQVTELQTLLQLERDQGADPAHLTVEQSQRIALAGAVAAQTAGLQQQQQVMQDLAGTATSIFSTVGDAIAQAFVQGQGAAVNWGNVTKAVISQVIQKFGELAIINPILNSVFGGSRTTLTDAVGALTAASSSSASGTGGALGVAAQAASANSQVGGGTSGSSLLSDAGSLFSVGKALFPDLGSSGSGGGFLSGITNSIGLTGTNGALSGLTSFLNTPIIAPTLVMDAPLAGATLPGATAPAFVGGATIGSALGGVGAGFGVGSLAGGFEQQALGKTGPAPTIGAELGATIGVAAAALAPETFGASLLLAGLVGGLGGGLGGGLIGPKPGTSFGKETVVA